MIVFANRNQIHPRRAAALLLFCGFAAVTWAQDEALVRGTVFAPTDEPVAGARVEADGRPSVLTGEDGSFELSLPPGTAELTVSHPAYRRLRQRIEVPAEPIELRLDWVASVEESVTVVGIRAGDDVPVTKRNMDREEIEKLSYGQDVPELLEYTPSMNWYSDSGIGAKYSYFSMRGIQQTRISMTFDGAPLGDPAEHALFFNNFHDFTSAVDSIQIQRGVGTTTAAPPPLAAR